MIEVFIKRNIFSQFLAWYFFDVPRAILKGWRNFLAFNFHYFSIPLLARTLFSYWRRYHESYGRGFDIKKYFEVFIFHLTSRIIGAVVRTAAIIIGLVAEILVFIAGLMVFSGWFLLPFLLFYGVIKGVGFLI